MVWIEFKRFSVPFLIAVAHVLTAALAIGILPALWILFRGRRWGLVIKWGFVAAVCLTAAVYALPLASREWKKAAEKGNGYRFTGVLVGYAITALFAPMIIPEPLRIAKRRLRNKDRERGEDKKSRRRRRKRRSQQLPGELKIR
jgi:hypothetical protein